MNVTLELVGVGILILLNAFFVAGEYGLVTARRTRMRELEGLGNRRASSVLKILDDPPRFIAAMQLGVTFTSLGIGALGEQALAHVLDDWMATIAAVVVAYLILSYFEVVVGELVPKAVALGRPERTALALSAPVRAFVALFRPAIWFLQRSTEVVLRLLGLQVPGPERQPLSEAELRMLLIRSSEEGEIEQQEQQMIDKVFVFGDKDVADVMVPRPEVTALSIELPPEQALAAVLESRYTRYPVYRETLDDVVGVLHVRDLFSAMHERGLASVRIEDLLRPAHIVPETKDLAALLQEFRKTNNHFAVVVDEYGDTAGIATLEDLIEEIVGEIEDEFDVVEIQIEKIDEDRYRIDGGFKIDDFNERFGTELPDDDYNTVGGFVFGELGRAPEVGDDLAWNGLQFDVLEVEGNRIDQMAVTFVHRPDLPESGDESAVGDELE